MALKTINDLTALTTPASTDLVGVWAVGAARMRKSTIAQVMTAGSAAILTAENVFTAVQNIDVNSIDYLFNVKYAGNTRVRVFAGNIGHIDMIGGDNADSHGCYINLGHNTNGSTPAAGYINYYSRTGQNYTSWVDNTGLIRIHTSVPSYANDTAGSVVGAQTSHIDYKTITGEPVDDQTALSYICAAAAQVAQFVYKSGAYNAQEFSGLILDGNELDRYGQDVDENHPAGKSLNVINAIGDLFLAMRGLAERVVALEAA